MNNNCDICVFVDLLEGYTVKVMEAFSHAEPQGWNFSADVRHTIGCCEFVENFWNYLGDFMPEDVFTKADLDNLLAMCWLDYSASVLCANNDPLIADGVNGMKKATHDIQQLFDLGVLDASLGIELPESWN